MGVALPQEVRSATRRYLAAADRLAPGAITAVAVGGSVALGAYRIGSSDIDLIAVIDDDWRDRPGLIRRLRALHLSQLPRLLGRAARGKGFSSCCNTSFIWASDLARPVTQIAPIASHVGWIFDPRGAFDVNPVIWHELAHAGIAIRGPEVSTWGLDPEPDQLKPWTRHNLNDYWKPLMNRITKGRRKLSAARVEWCLLGPARMHATLTTGQIVSKQEAGRHALETFGEHAPILNLALTHLNRTSTQGAPPPHEWRQQTDACMRDIITAAEQLPH